MSASQMQPGMQCSANGNAEGPTSEVSPQQRDAPSMLGDDVSGDEHHAAAVIQRAWRRIARKRLFWLYRDSVAFRAQGDPAKMLKAINPREAQLLDKAAGVHLKFRLGGDTFPPGVYYRIFTHRPVEDLCANSPKDYTAASSKPRAARVHNLKLPGTESDRRAANSTQQGDRSGWYQRFENNGWRRIDETSSFLHDPVTVATSAKRISIHHNKARRKEDVERQRRKRKAEWTAKLYKQGLVRDISTIPGDPEGCARASSPAEEGRVAGQSTETQRTKTTDDDEDDDEVEDLLCWSADLDFNQYIADWQAIGTSCPSDLQDAGEVERYSALLLQNL